MKILLASLAVILCIPPTISGAFFLIKFCKRRKIEKMRSEYEKMANGIMNTFRICDQLHLQTEAVTHLIAEFYSVLRDHLSSPTENAPLLIAGLNSRMVGYRTNLRKFGAKLGQVLELNKEMETRLLESLQAITVCEEKVEEAETLLQIYFISVTDLDWMNKYPNIDIYAFVNEWNAMDLERKVKECVEAGRVHNSECSPIHKLVL